MHGSFSDGVGGQVWTFDRGSKDYFLASDYPKTDEEDIALKANPPLTIGITKTFAEFPYYNRNVLAALYEFHAHELGEPMERGWFPSFSFTAGDATSAFHGTALAGGSGR